MSNNLKLLLLKKKSKKNTKTNIKKDKTDEQIFEDYLIKSGEINKLKNPKKGQIFIYFLDDTNFQVLRFNGKSWIKSI
tara:strand:- start:345 stop:578 length:234 start_codon:yes stop_codon:yes gene_type:complete